MCWSHLVSSMNWNPAHELSGIEVFQVLVVSDHPDCVSGTFQVASPQPESCIDHKEFLIINFRVQFCQSHCPGVEGNRANVIVNWINLGNDSGNCIVRGISFHNNRKFWKKWARKGAPEKASLSFRKASSHFLVHRKAVSFRVCLVKGPQFWNIHLWIVCRSLQSPGMIGSPSQSWDEAIPQLPCTFLGP